MLAAYEELPILSPGLLLEGKPHSSHSGSSFLDRFQKKMAHGRETIYPWEHGSRPGFGNSS